MNRNWLEAAEKYERRTAELETQKSVEQRSAAAVARADKAAREQMAKRIEAAANELRSFVASDDGRAALVLLAASKRHLIFGEDRGGGTADVAFIDGEGLRRSVEAHGMWMAYADPKSIPKPQISPITALNAIRSAVNFGGRQPEEVLPWLYRELNKIAEAVG